MTMDNVTACWQAAQAETLPLAYEALRASQKNAVQQVGWPTRKMERWKYVDTRALQTRAFRPATVLDTAALVSAVKAYRAGLSGEVCLLVLVNGRFDESLSDALPADIRVESLCGSDVLQIAISASLYPMAALNQSLMQHGLCLHVSGKNLPVLHIVSLLQGDADSFVNTTLHVQCEADSALTVVEHVQALNSAVTMNQLVTLTLAPHAKLEWVKAQQTLNDVAVFSHYHVAQAEASAFLMLNYSHQASFSRDEVVVHLNGPHAHCETRGIYYLQNNQQCVDNHVEVLHGAPHTNSEMLYKGILDQASRAVFNGRLWIGPETPHITAYQGNHHLLLSNAAEAYSKPELEIYTDEVKCKHGSTTGQLDQEALFYLRSRGLSADAAKQILMMSFVDEVVSKIQHVEVKKQIATKVAEQWI